MSPTLLAAVAVACFGAGLILLIVTALTTWRAYRRASRRSVELSSYANQQALEIERLTVLLNEHGFQLERTASDLGPKVERLMTLLQQPLIAASLPWLIRRLLGRPYRRR